MISFDQWFEQLEGMARKFNWPLGERENWLEYYEDGYTPRHALWEDMSYAAEES